MNALNELMCVIAKLTYIIQDHIGHIQLGTLAATIMNAAFGSHLQRGVTYFLKNDIVDFQLTGG